MKLQREPELFRTYAITIETLEEHNGLRQLTDMNCGTFTHDAIKLSDAIRDLLFRSTDTSIGNKE